MLGGEGGHKVSQAVLNRCCDMSYGPVTTHWVKGNPSVFVKLDRSNSCQQIITDVLGGRGGGEGAPTTLKLRRRRTKATSLERRRQVVEDHRN